MSSSGRPSALTRLRRNVLGSIGVVVIGVLAVGSGGLAEASQVRLVGQVDQNWRGAYDILVRSQGAKLDLERTNGLVEPNFLSFDGHGGITIGELAAIRAIGGVEVAAPIAFLGYLQDITAVPTMQITKLPDRPTLYEAILTITTSDGLSERLVQRETGRILLGPPPKDPAADTHWVSDFPGISFGVDGSGNPIVDISAGHAVPAIAIAVMAVDPQAERDLLGPSASFLERFAELTDRDHLIVSNMNTDLIPPEFGWSRTQIQTLRDPRHPNPAGKSRPIVPIVVSQDLYVGLKLSLDVSQVGRPLTSYPPSGTPLNDVERLTGSQETAVGQSNLDATAELRPFQPSALVLPFPGSDAAGGGSGFQTIPALDTRLAARPIYLAAPPLQGSQSLSFRIVPKGEVNADGTAAEPTGSQADGASGFVSGAFSAYRSFTSVPLAVPRISTGDTFDGSFILAPIGTFDLSRLDLPTNPLTHVPLGAYQPPSTTYVADRTGSAVPPQAMTPTVSQAGLVVPPPLAITDLAAAELLRGTAPIDAIRVRVAGLSGFDDTARAKVERVATEIAALGLDVEIVAGSSPQAINLYVPEYDASTTPASDLGWVRQEWTTIGAAQRIESAFGQTNMTLLLLAILSGAIFCAGLQVIELARRTREIVILRAIGWSRTAIIRWTMAEAVLAALVILALAMVGWAIGGRSGVALAGGLSLALISIVSAAGGTLIAYSRARISQAESGEVSTRPPLRGVAVTGIATFASRSLLTRLPRSAIEVAGLAMAGTAIGASVVTLSAVGTRSGPTLLAGAVGASIGPFQLVLVVASSLASFAFVVAAARLDGRARSSEFEILRSAGWTGARMLRLVLLGRYLLALPASLVGAIGAFVTTVGLGLAPEAPAAALVAVVVVLGVPGVTSLIWRPRFL